MHITHRYCHPHDQEMAVATGVTHVPRPQDGPKVDPALRPKQGDRVPADPAGTWPGLQRLGSTIPLGRYLALLWGHREFAATVPLGQLQTQHQDSVLGRIWNLLNPLLLIAVYYLIFQVILGIESRRGVDNYLPFLTVGILTYNYSRGAANGGALAIITNRGLMQTLYFPRALLPITATIVQGLSHLYSVAVMLVLLPLLGVRPTAMWLLLPVVLSIHSILNLGVAFGVARITYHFRDFQKFLSYILRIGMYVSGVLIPINADLISSDVLLWTLRLLPFYSIIEITRETLLGIPFDPVNWIVAIVWAIVLLTVGFWYFRQAENDYANV